ncbi:hypothetical protein NEIELOOT_02397 [Neisseria elongata subsp. glycolytica ATCC 29315]|uniref:Uncharacterized protein n=1 Tax=Neisseria elongata subsp. glycolytica ATCC 29315 TaxID=546263 RepID=D4DTJ2_NEIEG|nr:hypothetical protein NEIELOOT_02397 [Neisseria elongata subsp. glycolytica ATCC 29315]
MVINRFPCGCGAFGQCVKRRSVRYFSAKKRESWLKWFSDGLFSSYVYDFHVFYFLMRDVE